MPEGDSLRRAEALLSPVLDGQIVSEAWFRKIRGHRPRPGQRVERVKAVGKNLLIEFDRRLTLRTHLGMSGWWRASGPESRPPRDPRLRIFLRTESGTAMGFAVPTIDTFIRDGTTTPLDALGPDMSDDFVDLSAVVDRVRDLGSELVLAEALLDQRISAGIGNVFKSEVAFLAGIHPFVPTTALSDRTIERTWGLAHGQLLDNRERSSRKTTSSTISGRTYVYGRVGRACRRCSGSVQYSAAGVVTTRSTYWCPRCQPRISQV